MKYNGVKLPFGLQMVIRKVTFEAFNKKSKQGFQRQGKYALGRLTAKQHVVFAAVKKRVAYTSIRQKAK